MGWLFTFGNSRQDLIADRTKAWDQTKTDGTLIKTVPLAHCFRGGAFSGVLWAVWERSFEIDGLLTAAIERWITCDLFQYRNDSGWGYKDLDEAAHPYNYSCPLKYLALAPLERFGGNAEWRDLVRQHHARIAEKRRARKVAWQPLRSASS